MRRLSLCLCLCLLAAATLAAAAPPIVGSWRLVDQRTGDGDWGPPVEKTELHFVAEGGRIVGRLLVGEGAARRDQAWAPVDLILSDRGDRALARYRTTQEAEAGEQETVEITEDCQVSADGRSLSCEVKVAVPDGGSYRMRRRFDRLP
jgi:hypothetical protein